MSNQRKGGRGGGGNDGGRGKSTAMKYEIRADIKINGTVQRKDIIGAIMGQTEGLLGDDLELRKLQRTARVGHVDVETNTSNGKVHGLITIPSSLDNVETAIIASSLETIDRIGPCNAIIKVLEIRDIRATKRTTVVERAKELLLDLVNNGESATKTVIEEVRSVLTVGQAQNFHGLTCGPNVESSASLIIVEGRNDVKNLLNCGIKNAISADGAGDIKQELVDLAATKDTVIVAIDGDRGGEMLFQQLHGMMKVDFVAQAPVGQEWELLPQKTVTTSLSKKEDANKFAARLEKKQKDDDAAAGVPEKDWAEGMNDEFDAPEEIQDMMGLVDGLERNHAQFVMADGSTSEAIPAKELAERAEEADGAVAIVVNSTINDRMIEIASTAAIPTLVGTKPGKGFEATDDVDVWFTKA